MSLIPAILASLREGYVPADAIGGLLDNWCGPVEHRNALGEWEGVPSVDGYFCGGSVHIDTDRCRLSLFRRECRLQVAAVLAAGERCNGFDLNDGNTSGCDPNRGDDCPICYGSGWSRTPTKIWHLLPASEVGPGGLLPELAQYTQYAPELIACSVARALAGLSPVHLCPHGSRVESAGPGWVRFPPARETPSEEDVRTALDAGFAILDATGLRAPWPEGA